MRISLDFSEVDGRREGADSTEGAGLASIAFAGAVDRTSRVTGLETGALGLLGSVSFAGLWGTRLTAGSRGSVTALGALSLWVTGIKRPRSSARTFGGVIVVRATCTFFAMAFSKTSSLKVWAAGAPRAEAGAAERFRLARWMRA